MPWFKVDDSFESHPKVKSIPKRQRVRAIGLWTLAGSWCARQLTDGFVPDYMLAEFCSTSADATLLVGSRLWLVEEGGYRFNDWDQWQPTKEKVTNEREAAKERMRAARERKKQDVRANDSATPPNSSDEVRSTQRSLTPTRPDPTRPDPIEEQTSPDGDVAPSRTLALVADDRPDVDRICDHLADRIEANGSKRPVVTAKWRDSARLMLDRDGRSEDDVHAAIDWSQADEFWRGNVLSLPKLREKYDQLRLQASRSPRSASGDRNQQQRDLLARALERAEAKERNGA